MRLFLTGMLFFLLLASACNRPRYTREADTVKQISARADSLRTAMLAADTGALIEAGTAFEQRLISLEKEIKEKGDTIGPQVAYTLRDFARTNRDYQSWRNNWRAVNQNLTFSQQQLSDLQHDLEHNLIADSDVDKVIAMEKQSAEEAMQLGRQLMIARDSLIVALKLNAKKADSLSHVLMPLE